MLKRLMFAVLLVLLVPGCGGGGSNTTTASLADYAGVWTVKNTGLPSDQLLIDNAGNVMVSLSATKADAKRYRIGECSATGIIDVAGSWPATANTTRHIQGEGVVTVSKVTLSVVVKDGDTVIADGTTDGSSLDVPPPPPYGTDDVDAYEEYDRPPVPPEY